MIFALISALAWSVFDLIRKKLASTARPLSLAIWFALGVTPFYAGLWLFSGAALPQSSYWLPGLISVLAAAIASVSYIRALSVGRIAMLVPVLSFTPVVAALLSWVLLGDTLTLWQVVAIAVIVLAIFLLHGGTALLVNPAAAGPGFGLMLLVSLCWGVVIVLDKWALASAAVFFHGMVQSGGMALLLWLALIKSDGVRNGGWRPVYNGPLWLLLVALLVFLTAVSSQWFALSSVHPGIVETVKRGTGILGAALWGVWFFQESVHKGQLGLMLVIIAATTLLTLS
ncbi:EamA family transporter [Thalassolituus sp. LLYu03]|uniref:EamA family transporter n=1 Tax=Thalassolituus sp. LLYu03 TaxID=3421656 RepID=UPI003D28EC59